MFSRFLQIVFVLLMSPWLLSPWRIEPSARAEVTQSQRAFFENKIRPVLVKHCYECHSDESSDLGGKLRLDSRSGILEGGESGPALVATKPDKSLILQALRYQDLKMPPTDKLPETTIRDFESWIAMGAPDPREDVAKGRGPSEKGKDKSGSTKSYTADSLWSFMPRQQPAIPAIKDVDWPKDTLDTFVLSAMDNAGLRPASDASDEVLIRRLFIDLIGLPPSRSQITEFLEAAAVNRQLAIRRLVDRLLESPEYGVRWGRHWLDVARFGESNGNDGLGRNASFPHAWRYRDYVVERFNQDLPFDQFLREQIAGDLLPAKNAEERNRQLIATGFLAIGSKPAVAMNNNFAMDIVDDQINVIGSGILGLSVACARCHDHKHDPISTNDYYALAGIFASTETLYGAAGNEKLTAPPTPLHELCRNWSSNQEVEPDRTPNPVFPADYSSALDALNPVLHAKFDQAPEGLDVEPTVTYSAESFAKLKDNTLRGKFAQPTKSYSVAFWFKNETKLDARPITAYLFSRAKFGDKALPGDHLGLGGAHDTSRTGKLFVFNGNAAKQSIVGKSVIPKDSWNHVVLVRDQKQVRLYLNGRLEIDSELKSTFGDTEEYCLANRSDNFAPLEGHLAEFVLFDRALSETEALQAQLASGQPRGKEPAQIDGYAMGVRDKAKPSDIEIHIGGEVGKQGKEVPRGVLTSYRNAMTPEVAEVEAFSIEGNRSGRRELAEWLTDPQHPQTARVIVNRVWLNLFGEGLVATPDDFGAYGARPTHPELLDHLSHRFVTEGWSLKSLIRSIVLSRTYQLSSEASAEAMKADLDNRWLSRHLRRRLDAEALRDRLLHAADEIDLAPGSASAIHELDALINKLPDEAPPLHRPSHHRSLYLSLLRNSPPNELAAFDLPSGIEVQGKREVTMLPSQSLFLLNSPFIVDQAVLLSEKLLKAEYEDEAGRVAGLFEQVLQRAASESEVGQALEFLQETERLLATEVTDPERRRHRAWASLCHALFATSEFRYVD